MEGKFTREFHLPSTENAGHYGNVPSFAAVRAAWFLLASRYTDSDAVVLQAPTLDALPEVDGRLEIVTKSNRGHATRQTFLDWRATVQELLSQARKQEDTVGDPSSVASCYTQSFTINIGYKSPFWVSLAVRATSLETRAAPVKNCTCPQENASLTAQCSLIFDCRIQDGKIIVHAIFDPQAIKYPQVQRMVDQWDHTFQQIHKTENDTLELTSVETISERDKSDVWKWNETVPKAVDACVHGLISSMADEQPDRIAVFAWDGQVTYRALDEQSNQLAHSLVQRGVNKGTGVVICFEKSMYVPIAMLAVLKAGGITTLVSADVPAERLRFMCQRSQPVLAITFATCQSKIPTTIPVFTFDEILADRADEDQIGAHSDLRKVCHDDSAFIVFASGSTGDPKGIVWSHRSLCINTERSGIAFGMNADTRIFQFASYMFDVSILETLTALMYGACVCIPSEHERVSSVSPTIVRMQANWICLTPSTSEGLYPQQVPTLRTIVFGGEALSVEQAAKWGAMFKVINCYGPAECSFSTFCNVTPGVWKAGTVGTSTAGVCWIVDPGDYNRLLPIGAVGELLVEGPVVAKGYLHDPEKTSAAFIENPRWMVQGTRDHPGRQGRLYKTGDLVHYDAEGRLVYIGRRDSQIKLRGQRVELEEIEQQICRSLRRVLEVRVIVEVVIPDVTGHPMLVAFISASDPIRYTKSSLEAIVIKCTADLGQDLEERLPAYMIPSVYRPMYRFPTTAADKVDRRQLRINAKALTIDQLRLARTWQSLETPTESELRQLWADILGLAASIISSDDSFLQIGGDSVKLMRLLPRIEQKFGVQLSVQNVLRQRSLKQLAQLIDSTKLEVPDSSDEVEVERLLVEVKTMAYGLPVSSRVNGCKANQTPQRVFLTGATGYVGTILLYKLLKEEAIIQVTVLVRASSLQHARARIVKSALKAGWWHEKYLSRIRVWLGDLGKEQLGLSKLEWSELSGMDEAQCFIDGIVHNGAIVNWYSSYSDLRPVNVISMYQLLEMAATNAHLRRLVFVSTGPESHDCEDTKDVELYLRRELNGANGYWKSKLVAEKVIAYANCTNRIRPGSITVVKPGFIIGNTAHAIPNVDDFIWRVVAGAISIGQYPEQQTDLWIYVDTCDNLSDLTVECLQGHRSERPLMQSMLGGLRVSRFWAAVNAVLESSLKRVPFKEWYEDLRLKCQSTQGHPALSVLHEIRCEGLGLGSTEIPLVPPTVQTQEEQVEATIRDNVIALVELGYFKDWSCKSSSTVFKRHNKESLQQSKQKKEEANLTCYSCALKERTFLVGSFTCLEWWGGGHGMETKSS